VFFFKSHLKKTDKKTRTPRIGIGTGGWRTGGGVGGDWTGAWRVSVNVVRWPDRV
jgi:hypothetical protein